MRNRGTIGGSIAHADPAADWPVVLLALGAEVTVSSANEQRHMSLAEFLKAPFETALQRGEILTAVHIPSVPQNARWGYYKFCRMHGHFAETIAGVFLDPDRGTSRAVIGATEARPTIIETTFTENNAMEVIEAHIPNADWYQRKLHSVALKRALEEARA